MNRLFALVTLVFALAAACLGVDSEQCVVEIAGAGHTAVPVGSAYATYCYGPMGLISRRNHGASFYEEFIFDPFGSPLQSWQSDQVTNSNPALNGPRGNLIYDAFGRLMISRRRTTGGANQINDPIGALSQWGNPTDEELRDGLNDLVLTNRGVYDPDSIRYVGRGPGMNPYKAIGVGFGSIALAFQQALGDVGDSADALQDNLDLLDAIPVVGEPIDAVNSGISLGRGNWGRASLSLGAMVPIAGNAVTAGKVANRLSAGKVVLGRYPAYVNKATRLGAKRFEVPAHIWEAMDEEARWLANKKFLDRAVARGDEFILATRPSAARSGTYFEKELAYLRSLGYRVSSGGWRLLGP